MKILAIAATLVVFLCCLEVALGYPAYAAKPKLPQAIFQGRASFRSGTWISPILQKKSF